MKYRHTFLIVVMVVELMFIFFCLFQKSNRVPMGYICALLSFVLLICTGWLLLFPKIPVLETTGNYGIGYEESYYVDSARIEKYAKDGSFREIPAAFWYPEDYDENQKYPLVLFSHGSFGVRDSNITLYRELASHGYVVVSIDHTYQCFSTKLSNGKTIQVSGEFMKEIGTDNPKKNPAQSLIHFDKWMELRTGDINFVLDTIISKVSNNSQELEVYKLIDTSRIGVMGHSLGGSAALGVGRQRDDVSAVISLEAPFLDDIKGIDENNDFIFEESNYLTPILNIYSDASWENLREWSQYKENARLLENESDTVQNVHLSGIGHFGLTDFSLTSPFLTMVFDGGYPKVSTQETLKVINEICLEFLNQFLWNK